MSLREASERLKKQTEELKEEVKGVVQNLGGSIPRPLMERPTLILKEPLIKQLMRRRERGK